MPTHKWANRYSPFTFKSQYALSLTCPSGLLCCASSSCRKARSCSLPAAASPRSLGPSVARKASQVFFGPIQAKSPQARSNSLRSNSIDILSGEYAGPTVQPEISNSLGSGYSASLVAVAGRAVAQHDKNVGCAQDWRMPGKYGLLKPNPPRLSPGAMF